MEKSKLKYILQPGYYKDFSCIGGACPNSCCIGWRIDWDAPSYEKLQKAECSDKLRELIDTSFLASGDKYIIKLGENQRCPFLTKENLCFIQKELGAGYLSTVCTSYPRKNYLNSDTGLRSCMLSCYPVVDRICSDEKTMSLEKYRSSAKNITITANERITEEDIKTFPEMKYRGELFEFFYDIISDKSYDIETALIIGALAAQKITVVIEKGNYDFIPQMTKELKKQLKSDKIVSSVASINTVPEIRLGVQANIYDTITGTTLASDMIRKGTMTESAYQKGYKRFQEHFSDREFVLRNIMLNFMYEFTVPFLKKEYSLFENYSYFVAVCVSIKFLAAMVFNGGFDNEEHKFKISVTKISRQLAHNSSTINKLLNILKEYNCKSPAYLAVIVK